MLDNVVKSVRNIPEEVMDCEDLYGVLARQFSGIVLKR